MADRKQVSGWWVAEANPNAIVLERRVIESLTIVPGCWYDIKRHPKWNSGNVAHVIATGSKSVTANVYIEKRRIREEVGKLLNVPYTAFIAGF